MSPPVFASFGSIDDKEIRQFFSSHIEAVRAGTADTAIIQVVQESVEDLEELFYKALKKGSARVKLIKQQTYALPHTCF